MADNVDVTPGVGKTIATDDISGVQYQRVKLTWGGDGTADDVSNSAPLPVRSAINGISDGRKVVTSAGTRVALVSSSTSCKEVVITAEPANTGTIVVGGSTCVASVSTRQGVPLEPGDTFSFEIDDLSDIYIDATVSGEGVTFTYFT